MPLSKKPYLLFILFVFLQTSFPAFAQTNSLPLDKWVENLDDDDDTLNKNFNEIADFFRSLDTTFVFSALNDLERKGASAGTYFHVRIKHLRATMLWERWVDAVKDSIAQLMRVALQQAYQTDDDYLIATVSWWYGEKMYYSKEIEPAAMYCLNAVEILDKRTIPGDPHKYQLLGEIFYNIHDYERGLYYIRRAIENEKDTSRDARINIMSRWNTIALCWQKIGNYDSAFHYYDIAMQKADELNSEVWKGIISGNIGYIYLLQKKYDIAKPLLEFDYHTSKKFGEIANAANSLQRVASIMLLQGKKDSALSAVKEALRMLQQQPGPISNYLQTLYYTTADVYRVLGKSDSFYLYSQLYSNLHDSAERAIANSRLEISQLRLDNQSSIFKIRELQKEKDTKARERNFIIAAIILVAIGTLLILNRQRLKFRYQKQLAFQQKIAAENEMATAKEQLNIFTQSIIEKTKLIEQLQQDVSHHPLTDEKLKLANELSSQTILTEDDWEKFKNLFEKIYPGFCLKIQEMIPDISVAEQRLAAFTRLHLTTKQIASMLGTSPDSVYKIKQRLRRRLLLTDDVTIETYLTKI